MTRAAAGTSGPGFMRCPNCGTEDRRPPTTPHGGTSSCPKCDRRFPVDDGAGLDVATVGAGPRSGLADAKGG
jgi:Zn finger protein HypA/HybF involved in hydrogenase expression